MDADEESGGLGWGAERQCRGEGGAEKERRKKEGEGCGGENAGRGLDRHWDSHVRRG